MYCKRKNSTNWQFPQGGIDKNEDIFDAALRELYEEVGIEENKIKLIKESDNWYKYDLPKKYKRNSFLWKSFKGQKQKWFLFRLINDIQIHFQNDPDNEFIDYKWVPYWYPLYTIVEFKKEVYRSALNALRDNFCEEINND